MNEELMRAVMTADRARLRRLAVGAHEPGHALAGMAHGLDTKEIRLEFGMLGGLHRGVCDWVPFDERTSPEKCVAWLVGIMGGHVAEVRFCQLYAGMEPGKAFRYGRDWAEGDYQKFDHFSRQWRRYGVRVSRSWAVDQARRAVERHGARLDRLTLRLDHCARMPGSAL